MSGWQAPEVSLADTTADLAMVNIILATHGDLADALMRTAEQIVGPLERVFSVPLLPDESPEAFAKKLAVLLAGLKGQQTVVLVDLLGGTPYNVVARHIPQGHIECITGVNLPMVLELLMARGDSPPEQLSEAVAQAGRDAIRNLKSQLSERHGSLRSEG